MTPRQLHLPIIDGDADELEELTDRLHASGECPPEQRDAEGRLRCWRLSCPRHLRHLLRSGDRGHMATERQADVEEVVSSLVAMPWHCGRQWEEAHPDGATQQEVGDALGLSRQAVQDLERAAKRNLQRLRTGAKLADILDDMEEVRRDGGGSW